MGSEKCGKRAGTTVNAANCEYGLYYDSSYYPNTVPIAITDVTVENAQSVGIFIGQGVVASINGVTVTSSIDYGILNDGGTAYIADSSVSNIGESPFNGVQIGVGIKFADGAQGTIGTSSVSLYQKNGIEVTGAGSSAMIFDNTVTGLGPIGFIAQNGIQISYGALLYPDSVSGNTVTGNIYTQTFGAGWVATGVLLYQPTLSSDFGHANPVAVIARSNMVAKNQSDVTYIS